MFINSSDLKNNTYVVTGEDYHYIKNVLRLKEKDPLELRDGQNRQFFSSISKIEAAKIILTINKANTLKVELPVQLSLAQALPKSDKIEWIIQKCVELGAKDIIPIQAERSLIKINPAKEKIKLERWNKIAKNAAQQSGRGIIPLVNKSLNWPQLVETLPKYDLVLIPWELEEKQTLKSFFNKHPISNINHYKILIIIGPEGGFSAGEITLAKKAGAQTISLGPRILRTETAGMSILAMLNYIFSD
ncbi:MAG: 16S rRNA (uracil(1498)-N(3))-methyltransferase [Candidatus Margulisbacteria bacterium]|nr:16S rRNA (uracil(1498)-N(3))-methyltransferase [Candidatus Margulisiibacteriota bacterium]